MDFEKYNANPKDNKTSDCVIRAITTGLNWSWSDVLDELYKIAREEFLSMNDFETYKRLLKRYDVITPKVIKGKKRPKVEDFNDGTYILKVANHLTCVKNGVLYDIWDCRKKVVYRYWRIEE